MAFRRRPRTPARRAGQSAEIRSVLSCCFGEGTAMIGQKSLEYLKQPSAGPIRWRRKPVSTGIGLVLLVALALLGKPSAGEAQPQPNMPRLCFLTFDPGTLQTRSPRFD